MAPFLSRVTTTAVFRQPMALSRGRIPLWSTCSITAPFSTRYSTYNSRDSRNLSSSPWQKQAPAQFCLLTVGVPVLANTHLRFSGHRGKGYGNKTNVTPKRGTSMMNISCQLSEMLVTTVSDEADRCVLRCTICACPARLFTCN